MKANRGGKDRAALGDHVINDDDPRWRECRPGDGPSAGNGKRFIVLSDAGPTPAEGCRRFSNRETTFDAGPEETSQTHIVQGSGQAMGGPDFL